MEQNPAYLENAKVHLAQVTKILDQNNPHLSPAEIHAANGALHRNWGRIYLGEKNWELALGSIEQSKTSDPDNPKVHLLLAQLYNERCQQGDEQQFFKEVATYLEKMKTKGKWSKEEFYQKSLTLMQSKTCPR